MKLQPINLTSDRDQIFASNDFPKPFAFNAEVARVFDDMIHRSVPFYKEVTGFAATWAARFVSDVARIYDVGCSTGTTIRAICDVVDRPIQVIGVDPSGPMIERAKAKTAAIKDHDVQFLTCRANEVEMAECDVVVINYTLQFMPFADRKGVLKKIFAALRPGGMVFISEKIRSSCPHLQEVSTEIYERYKMHSGYTANEIARKKEALENVLTPLTESYQKKLLNECGFESCDTIFKWNNFASFVSIKPH